MLIDDLPSDDPPPCCPSCGVPYVDHLGLHGTCAQVQRLTTNARAREGVMRREGDLLRASQREADRLSALALEVIGWLGDGWAAEDKLALLRARAEVRR